MNAAPADVPATCMPAAFRRRISLRDLRTAERRRQTQLVAAGHENAVGFFDVIDVLTVLTILPGFDVQHSRVLDADFAKKLFVVSTGVFEFGRSRNNCNARVFATTNLDKPVEDLRIVESLLGSANRNDIAAILVADLIGRTHDSLPFMPCSNLP